MAGCGRAPRCGVPQSGRMPPAFTSTGWDQRDGRCRWPIHRWRSLRATAQHRGHRGSTVPADTARPSPDSRFGETRRGRGRTIDLLGGVLLTQPRHGRGPHPMAHSAGWSQAMAGAHAAGARPHPDLAHEDFAHDAPPITFSRDETYDENCFPDGRRTRPHRTVVPGRHRWAEFRPGTGIHPSHDRRPHARWAACAMNLDGGSSKRMAIGDRCVDLASTEVVAAGATPSRPAPWSPRFCCTATMTEPR